jgi:cytochrome P450
MAPADSTLAFLDPGSAEVVRDPHPTFDRLRAVSPVVRDPLGWSLLSYGACEAAFHDRALTPGIDPLLEQLGIGALWGEPGHTLTDSEGVDHQRLRRVVSPWFTQRRIEQLRERVRDTAGQIVDGLDGLGDGTTACLDAMAQLADIIPIRLFCWMVGAPDGDAADLARLSKVLLLVFTATSEMAGPVRAAKAELAEYTRQLLAQKRASPGDDLASMLAAAEASGALSEVDVFHLLEELLSASVDNTANTAGLALWTLACHPDQWSQLHADPALLARAVEELGRFQPAIRHTIKYALDDTVIDGTPIARGEFVTIRIAAAHRDPTVFADPHRLDIGRQLERPQLAFGAGRHYCLGAALGKMEVQEIVHALVSRWADCALGDGVEMRLNESGHVIALPLRLGEAVGR